MVPPRSKKPITEISIQGLGEYLAAHSLQLNLSGNTLYYGRVSGTEQMDATTGRYLSTVGKNALQLLKAIAKKENLPFLFRSIEGKFAGTVGNIRISGYTYSTIKLLQGKNVLYGDSYASFLATHTLDASATTESLVFSEGSKPKDILGSSFDIDDILIIGRRPGVVTEWDPLKELAKINFGSSHRMVDLKRDTFINVSRIDQPKIRQQLMIKRLMKK